MTRKKGTADSPFACLKGIRIPERGEAPPKRETGKGPVPDEDDAELFLRAVADASPLRPLSPRRRRNATACPVTTPDLSRAREQENDRLFAEAIKNLKLDVTFRDEVSVAGKGRVEGDRLAALQKGKIPLTYELDLHGLCREEAIGELARFIASARRHGERAVLVITGRGLHSSAGEPVLKSSVLSWLASEGADDVIETVPAPPELGGDGALVVFLRKRKPLQPRSASTY